MVVVDYGGRPLCTSTLPRRSGSAEPWTSRLQEAGGCSHEDAEILGADPENPVPSVSSSEAEVSSTRDYVASRSRSKSRSMRIPPTSVLHIFTTAVVGDVAAV